MAKTLATGTLTVVYGVFFSISSALNTRLKKKIEWGKKRRFFNFPSAINFLSCDYYRRSIGDVRITIEAAAGHNKGDPIPSYVHKSGSWYFKSHLLLYIRCKYEADTS